MTLEPSTSTFSSAPQKRYKPLLMTGCIPRIEKNRVRFLNGQTVAIGKYCSLYGKKEGSEFDPSKYCVMSIQKQEKNDMSGEMENVNMRFIADMDAKMYRDFMIAQGAAYRKAFVSSLEVGHKVHLFSKNGIYKIIAMTPDREMLRITCQKWNTEFERRYRELPYAEIPIGDVKCLAGGTYNTVFT